MLYVILNWNFPEDVEIVREDDGTPMLFDDQEEAVQYAEENLNWKYKVVELEK